MLAKNRFGVEDAESQNKILIMLSVSLAARTSYTVVGDEKEINYQRMIDLHDRLLAQDPPHSSPMEHCARAMSNEEYETFIKGEIDTGFDIDHNVQGWCRNYKGFYTI
jgi:hypothetical protein